MWMSFLIAEVLPILITPPFGVKSEKATVLCLLFSFALSIVED